MYDNKYDSEVLLCLKNHSFTLITLGTVFQIFSLVSLIYFSIAKTRENQNWFWISLFSKIVILTSIMWICGYYVENYKWKVAYTRKIVHAFFFTVPFIFDIYLPLPDQDQWLWGCWNLHIILWLLLLITKPVRQKIKFIQTMYASSDRPEDKGLSQIYATIQIPLSILVICIFYIVFESYNKSKWILVPIISVAIGDGLAEPVFQLFEDYKIFGGPHKYKVKGLFSGNREFIRSIEGSTTVFTGTVISIMCLYTNMSQNQFIFIISILPLTMTVVECFAPHSMDNPILLLWGNLVMLVAIFI